MGRILLVRHGQASLLQDDYDQLSPLGRAQASAVGRWLGARLPAPPLMVTGALKRQSETARECASAAGWDGAAVSIDAGFDEYSHHDLLARTFPHLADPAALGAHLRESDHPRREFQSLFAEAFANWLRGDSADANGLTWPAFRQRCLGSLRAVAAACGSGQYAVVVTSGGPIAAICQALLGLSDERVPALHTPLFNASITHLLTRGAEVGLSIFNSVAHLEVDEQSAVFVTHR